MPFRSALILSTLALLGAASVNAATVTLTASPNPANYGAPVALSATVSPASSGTVAFYDGVKIIGVAPLANGTGTLTTRQLPSGTRKLTARAAGAVSPAVTETINALPAGSFNPVATYPVGPPAVPNQPLAEKSPAGVAVGDFNNDGKLDAVLPVYSAATGADSEIALLLGNGNGTFGTASHITAGTNLVGVAVGDFNGDGKLDLAVADGGSPFTNPVVPASINILLGNGNGTFLPPSIFPISVSGFTPYALVIGDFNLDGKEDIAVTNQTGTTDVAVLLGNGNGTLGGAITYSTGTQIGAFGLALGDYNGDGLPDLAVAEDVLVILQGQAGGSFVKAATEMTGMFPNDVQTGDFNNDGKADLAVSSATDSAIYVLIGNGNGTFAAAAPYTVGPNPESITVGDFNGDGKQDLAVADSYLLTGDAPPPGSVSLLNGNGNGTFASPQTYNVGPAPVQIVQGDFTGGGTIDLATADFGDGSDAVPGNLGVLLSAGCVTISSTGQSAYNANGSSFIVFVNTTGPSCSWTATSTVPWMFLSASGGTGPSQIAVTVVQNTTGADRSGSVLIGGNTLNITQDFTTQVFADVPPGSYFFDAVNLLSAKAITAGCGPSAYCPTTVISRAQMAVFIVRAVYGSDNFTYSPTPYFTDVTPSTFGFKWIQKMYELGITSGCAPGLFCPTGSVSRDQMAVFIIRARFGTDTNFTYNPTPIFNDVPVNAFAFKWIQRMSEDAITSGCAPSLYCPSGLVTRGDMAVFVMRGAFNQVLANPALPVITSVTPNTLAPGASATFTVNGANVAFLQGVTVVAPVFGADPVNGITAGPITLTGPSQFTVTLTASPSAPAQPYSVYVQTNGVEAVLPNAIVVP